MKNDFSQTDPKLPWWTWVLPFFLLFVGSFVSEYFRFLKGVSLFYLPIPIGIILINWWGPRVLVAYFINTLIGAYIWGFPNLALLPVLAAHQTSTIFLSWFLCSKSNTDVLGQSSFRDFLKFLFFGLLLPILYNSSYALIFSKTHYTFSNTLLIWFTDFFTNFSITIPIFYFLSPVLSRRHLIIKDVPRPPQTISSMTAALIDFIVVAAVFIVVSLILDFEEYWFVYGAISIFIALRHGFQLVILINVLTYTFIYLLPVFDLLVQENAIKDIRTASVHFGMSLLCVSATIIGRVISDLRLARIEQEKVNQQLILTNQELDRFVYSASHDLSSPLKSIKGLLSVIEIEKDKDKMPEYLTMIDRSVTRLENFIEEILDYSRSNRKEKIIKQIELKELVDEILDNYRYLNYFDRIRFEIDLGVKQMVSDPFLLKIALNNLISNAIKYQRKHAFQEACISVKAHAVDEQIHITITDNGEGIDPAFQPQIFEMFFRGTNNQPGSGLGLYIANTAITRLNGKISFKSTYGEGSVFTISLPIEAMPAKG